MSLTPISVIKDIAGDIPVEELGFFDSLVFNLEGLYDADNPKILLCSMYCGCVRCLYIAAHEANHAHRHSIGVPAYENLPVRHLRDDSLSTEEINEERIVDEETFLYLYNRLNTSEERKQLVAYHKTSQGLVSPTCVNMPIFPKL